MITFDQIIYLRIESYKIIKMFLIAHFYYSRKYGLPYKEAREYEEIRAQKVIRDIAKINNFIQYLKE